MASDVVFSVAAVRPMPMLGLVRRAVHKRAVGGVQHGSQRSLAVAVAAAAAAATLDTRSPSECVQASCLNPDDMPKNNYAQALEIFASTEDKKVGQPWLRRFLQTYAPESRLHTASTKVGAQLAHVQGLLDQTYIESGAALPPPQPLVALADQDDDGVLHLPTYEADENAVNVMACAMAVPGNVPLGLAAPAGGVMDGLWHPAMPALGVLPPGVDAAAAAQHLFAEDAFGAMPGGGMPRGAALPLCRTSGAPGGSRGNAAAVVGAVGLPPLPPRLPPLPPRLPPPPPPVAAAATMRTTPATNNRVARMVEALCHPDVASFVNRCMRGVGNTDSNSMSYYSSSGVATIAPTNSAASMFDAASPVTRLMYDPNFTPVNRHTGTTDLGVNELIPSSVIVQCDLVQIYRDLRRNGTAAYQKYLNWTGRNEPNLAAVARNNPGLLYILLTMHGNTSFLATVNTTVPSDAQAESGSDALASVPASRPWHVAGDGAQAAATPLAAAHAAAVPVPIASSPALTTSDCAERASSERAEKRMRTLSELQLVQATLKNYEEGTPQHSMLSGQADDLLGKFAGLRSPTRALALPALASPAPAPALEDPGGGEA